jgi:hypothetical protein
MLDLRPVEPFNSRDFLINIADFFADIYGKKCNTYKVGNLARSTIHI